jgi:hypothetical protein|nr:MAG TPA: hypothetical protein [Caudoviricetes sp.]
MLLKTGEQIENDLFHIFETVELDYEEVEKKVKIEAEIIESIIAGNEFLYIKEWLKLIKFVTKDMEYIECSDTITQIQEDIFLYGSKKLYKLKHKRRSRKHIKFIEVIDYEIMEEEDFGTCLALSEILMLFEFQNSII